VSKKPRLVRQPQPIFSCNRFHVDDVSAAPRGIVNASVVTIMIAENAVVSNLLLLARRSPVLTGATLPAMSQPKPN
jgi:hypothetical protein